MIVKARDIIVARGDFGRFYQAYFESKRNPIPELGVKVIDYDNKWYFQDTKLGFLLNVHLHERVYQGKTNLTAKVSFEHTDNQRIEQVDSYVKEQFKKIERDGMVKL